MSFMRALINRVFRRKKNRKKPDASIYPMF